MLFAKLLELRLLLSGKVEAFEGIALALCTFAGFVAGCFGARGGLPERVAEREGNEMRVVAKSTAAMIFFLMLYLF